MPCSMASVRVVCFSYQDRSGEKQGHPKLPGWKLQHGRWTNPWWLASLSEMSCPYIKNRGIKLAAIKGGLPDFTLSRFPFSLKDTTSKSWNLCGCLLLSCYRQAMRWVVSHRLVWFRRRLGGRFPQCLSAELWQICSLSQAATVPVEKGMTIMSSLAVAMFIVWSAAVRRWRHRQRQQRCWWWRDLINVNLDGIWLVNAWLYSHLCWMLQLQLPPTCVGEK